MAKTVLILGANSDVAKEAICLYAEKGYNIIAASRSTDQLSAFVEKQSLQNVRVLFFDAINFDSHKDFYNDLSVKPNILLYAAGFQIENDEALVDWQNTLQMINVHYTGAVSIINIVAMDQENTNLERIIGLSSLAGVRGRKSNFVYGSSKGAFSIYLAGLRQYLSHRNVKVNVIVAGYIRTKMTAGLELKESLMLEPEFIAAAIVDAGSSLTIVPGFKWKIIYNILRLLPEGLVAKLP